MSSVAVIPLKEQLSAQLKAASDPLRLDILRVLAKDSFGVTELCHIFAIKQSGMSHHLKVMASAGLVSTRREGNSIFYRRVLPSQDHIGFAVQQSLFQTVDNIPLDSGFVARRNDVYQERADASESFFSSNTDKFREQQELIASHQTYGDIITEMISSLPSTRNQSALEIGPGEGLLLPVLNSQFEKVVALDSSESMLEKARDYCSDLAPNSIEWIHGDTELLNQTNNRFHCVVINMVLHHTPSPASIVQDAAKALSDNGVLLISELCPHDQHWAREACGDLWLGLEPDDLLNWALDAQLTEGPSHYIALRNGFQIQIRQFQKPASTKSQ